MLKKKMAVLLGTVFLGVTVAAPSVWASPLHPNAGCNAGNGNGSETTPADDCDPGNSGGNNNGGD
jgi:hypothetical protein